MSRADASSDDASSGSGARPIPVSATRMSAAMPAEARDSGTHEVAPPSRRELDMRTLLAFSAKAGASDLHLTSGEPAAIRVHGEIKRLKMRVLTAPELRELVLSIMDDTQRAEFAERLELDFSYEVVGVARFRVNVFVDRQGVAAVMRTIPNAIPTMESLALPPVVQGLCERDGGLILVTGPTGSGKSTTLAAMLGSINATLPGRIITIEDPIEFVHTPSRSVVSQRELGVHTRSFSNALRAALREDPDVILVGEMRDLETISLAITAAETGHLVFSTLHSPSATSTIDRMIDVFPPQQQGQVRAQLADCLAAVVTQRLLPKIGGGRAAAFEVMIGTPPVRALVRDGKSHQLASVMQVGQKDGMRTMEAVLADMVDRNVIRIEDALALLPHGKFSKGSAAAA